MAAIAVGIVCADLAGWHTGARIPTLGIILHCHLQRLSSGHNDRNPCTLPCRFHFNFAILSDMAAIAVGIVCADLAG
jgi:hypothetical protein